MVFVPCRGGKSHTPEEWADASALAAGAAVLLETTRLIDEDAHATERAT
jgi:N-carbamoyl-L-amino-acid hydrolase